MRTILKTLLLISITLILTKSIKAQPCDLKPDDLPELKKLNLIVEKQTEELNTWFAEFWTFNKKIQFKTEEEILKIPDVEKEKYLILGKFYDGLYYTDYKGKQVRSVESLRMIGLIKLEDYKKEKKKSNGRSVNIGVYTPYNETLEDKELKPSEYKLTVKILSNQLTAIEKQQLKKYKTHEFAKDQADENCEKIAGKELFIDKSFIKDASDIAEIKRNKKFKLSLVTANDIAEKIENEEDVLISYSAPYAIQGSNEVLVYVHYIVNAKNGTFYYESGRGQFVMPGIYFRKGVFKDILECSK